MQSTCSITITKLEYHTARVPACLPCIGICLKCLPWWFLYMQSSWQGLPAVLLAGLSMIHAVLLAGLKLVHDTASGSPASQGFMMHARLQSFCKDAFMMHARLQ